jgi:hypothetical protein
MKAWELYDAGGVVATDPRGTKLWPDTLKMLPALGPAVGWNQFEFDEPPQVMPLTLPAASFVGNV